MGEEAHNKGVFSARRRTREKLRQSLKFKGGKFSQVVLVPAFRIKVVDEFVKQVWEGFHGSPAPLKEK
jgi:hypothetical protein